MLANFFIENNYLCDKSNDLSTMKYLSYILIILGVTLLLFVGCTPAPRYKIGVSQCSSDDWREKMNDEIRREILIHDEAEVEIRSADDSSSKQIDDIRYFVKNGFDIIIVAPNEAVSLTPVIKEVYESGMPVIIFDRNIDGDTYTARIGVDDEGIGKLAARYSHNLLGKNLRAIEISGLPGSTPAANRHKGFSSEFTARGGTILASAPANWNQSDAERVADSLLKLYPETTLIYAHNDRMAIGASVVAHRLGRCDIRILGVDAAPAIGLKAVADGTIDATFLYPTEGGRIIDKAIKILNGEKYEKETLFPATSAIDRSNADLLLLQYDAIKEETGKMETLKGMIDAYWERHSTQTFLLYSSLIILVLVCIVLFLILRSYWQNRRHQELLLQKNRLLAEERDKQKELNERLNEATQSKLVFFTNVSHDLRTPLTLIQAPVAQLADAPNLTSQQKALMRIADKNVRILHRLINQILDFRKYENGKLELHLTEVDFRSAVEEWVGSFKELARRRDIRLRLIAPEGFAPIPIAIDQEKVERILFNLISNAFRHTRDNGEITVSYSIIDSKLTLSVSDNGEGISKDDLGNIFDRFYQVDRIKPKGSGIGLALVKSFVELHGGNVEVESEPGKGSIFTITIPEKHISTEVESVDSNIGEGAVSAELSDIDDEIIFDDSRPHVLVIDDNADIRKMVGELLSDEYNITCAASGSEGLRRAAKYVPDLVICDVMMPGMDGMECCRRLKSETSTSHIPVLMLTACSLDEQRAQGYESGADGYVSKPFSTPVLKARVASLIKNRKMIRELWQNPVLKAVDTVNEKSRIKVDAPVAGMGDIENEFYRRFLEIFTSEMGNPDLSVDNLASRMGLERTQFYRKIKSLTNYSPVELIRHLRLRKARTLVTSTEKSISEIAYEIGFSTPAYFTKCYREAYGETPTETRVNR